MTISIVTGGAGFIGSHIVEKLKALDHMVVVIDNEYSDNDNFHWRKDTLNVNIDITDYKALKKAFTGADYIFHLAAEARIGPAIENPLNALNINTMVMYYNVQEKLEQRKYYIHLHHQVTD